MGSDGDRDWLVVGRVVKPHGIHGDLVAEIITDFPERLAAGIELGAGGESGPESFHELRALRYHKGRWLLTVRDVADRDAAEAWRDRLLFLPERSLDDLPEGFFYEHQLTGLACRSPGGDELGEVTGVDRGPGQRRLIVRRGRREFLVPYVPEIITEVRLDEGVVIIDAPPGLLDDDFTTA